jgi:peptidoglycan/xylan/chitin deacetylase (PgdA/CDA1 family)
MISWLKRRSAGIRRRVSRGGGVAVLCYHGLNAPRRGYENNDHDALEADLAMMRAMNVPIVRAQQIVQALRAGRLRDIAGSVAITMDDGPNVDWHDYHGEDLGHLKSMIRILREHDATGTSFVIASPDARNELDKTCIAGRGDWSDVWWRSAVEEGVLEIGNHSWDHNHVMLSARLFPETSAGDFFSTDTFERAEAQVARAQEHIVRTAGSQAGRLFAYPYGHVPRYLASEYLPLHGPRLGIEAAFSTAGTYVQQSTSPWEIPRFVCGEHWKTPKEFGAILRGLASGSRARGRHGSARLVR